MRSPARVFLFPTRRVSKGLPFLTDIFRARLRRLPLHKPADSALFLQVAFTLLYVIPLYFSSETRPSLQLSRDAPAVVRARMRAVGLACLITTLITVYVAFEKAQTDLSQTLQLLGWWPIDPFDIAKSLALVTVLFVGPLYESGVIDGQWRSWLNGRGFAETFSYTIGWRNYVVVSFYLLLCWASCSGLNLPLCVVSEINPWRQCTV